MARQTPFCVVIFLMLLLGLPAAVVGEDHPPPVEVVIHLRDGSTIRGRIYDQTDRLVVVENEVLGRLELATEDIDWIERPGSVGETPRRHWNVDPARNSVLLTPTPQTLPKGTAYFRSIELFLLNFGFAPTDWMNFAVGTIFPVSTELVGVMAGAKLRVLDRDKYPVGLALTGSYTYFSELQDDALTSFGAVLGIGDERMSLNVSVSGNSAGGENSALYMVGGDVQTGKGTKLIAELGTTSDMLLDDDDFDGILNVGFRFFSESMSFTLTGFRPLRDSGGFFLLPLGVFSVNW